MHFRTLGVSILALGLAACGGQDEPAPAAPTPAPEEVVETVETMPLYSVSALDLSNAILAGGTISATATDSGVLLSGDGVGNLSPGGRTGGASFEIADAVGGSFAGKTVTVAFTARMISGDTPTIASAYSTSALGNSGWQFFTITEEFEEYSFSYDVTAGEDLTPDYVGFVPAAGAVVELESVSVTVPE